jgi:hypothetical protein
MDKNLSDCFWSKILVDFNPLALRAYEDHAHNAQGYQLSGGIDSDLEVRLRSPTWAPYAACEGSIVGPAVHFDAVFSHYV